MHCHNATMHVTYCVITTVFIEMNNGTLVIATFPLHLNSSFNQIKWISVPRMDFFINIYTKHMWKRTTNRCD